MTTRLGFISALIGVAASSACKNSRTAQVDTTTPAPAATAANPAGAPAAGSSAADSLVLVRGTVASASPSSVAVKTDSATVTVSVDGTLRVFDRESSDVSRVKENSFVGVTSVKQPDGSERATEIHIFPEELRGLGEGSRMMTTGAAAGGSRMTNGSASPSRMTNGSATPAPSRMSNGSVASKSDSGSGSGGANAPMSGSGGGTTLVVQYAGGSQTIAVPAGTPVTELVPVTKRLGPGDAVVLVATRRPDGSLAASKALLTKK